MNTTAVLGRADARVRESCELAVETLPWIRREGIEWTGGLGNAPLELRLTFENPGLAPSVPTPAAVRIADFGAFLPWRPLTTVTVPAIPPGGRAVVTATAAAFRPERPTPPDPRDAARLLRPIGRERLLALFRANRERALNAEFGDLSHPAYYAGNFSVHIGQRRPAERHMGSFACLKPGRATVGMFGIGTGKPDTYTVTVPERPRGWSVRADMPGASGRDTELVTGITAQLTHGYTRAIVEAPADAKAGRVVFGVAQASTGQSTTVELELEKPGR